MMIQIFFPASVLLVLLIVLFRNKNATKIISIGFALMLIWFTYYCLMNPGRTELTYFTFSSAGVLLLTVLALLSLPTFYHGFIYTDGDDIRKHTIYHVAKILLMTFMAGAYLA